jgi:hypothetical protein
MWYEWDSLEAFNAWHEALKQSLGYPLISTNQATGLPDPDAQITENYTSAIEVEGKFIALVGSDYAEGLTPTALRLPRPSDLA